MTDASYICLSAGELPPEPDWLHRQACPVIALGGEAAPNADVVADDERELRALVAAIERTPVAAMTLVQVLRVVDLPADRRF